MTFPFYKKLIKRKDNLFKLIYEFNILIANYLHHSHIANNQEILQLLHAFKDNPKAITRISEYFLTQFHLKDNWFFNFEDPIVRIALLTPSTLEKLMLYTGSAIYAEQISKIISKTQLSKLKEDIGDNVYQFVTKRAFLLSTLTPKIEKNSDLNAIDKITLYNAGKRCLEYLLADQSEALLKRFVLKFNADLSWTFSSAELGDQKLTTWNYLQKILFKEIEPNLKICFT